MPQNTEPYDILVGVGELWTAPVGTSFPDVDATPGASWTQLGETDGGVTVTLDQTVDLHRTDQRTGAIKATRSEEDLTIESALAEQSLENLAELVTEDVVDTPPGAGTIGIRELDLYRGSHVSQKALLFRGTSPYGDYPAQYQVPRGIFTGGLEREYTKEGKTLITMTFSALEDMNAASEAERFGKIVAQDADAQ